MVRRETEDAECSVLFGCVVPLAQGAGSSWLVLCYGWYSASGVDGRLVACPESGQAWGAGHVIRYPRSYYLAHSMALHGPYSQCSGSQGLPLKSPLGDPQDRARLKESEPVAPL